jgi:N-acetylglucosamine-6-phosphate deacetylase
MILLSGATLVLPDRLVDRGEIAIDSGRILEVATEPSHDSDAGSAGRDLTGHYIVPGFVDVHVHGVLGIDSLDGGDAVARIAAHLPRFGVTAFCPTSVACPPRELREMLRAVTAAIETPDAAWARVLPAHLESNFINPAFNGAQPLACLRTAHEAPEGQFPARDVLDEIEAAGRAVGIVTLAPEMDGVLDLIPALVKNGHCVSLGHSGASYDQARAGIAAGARQATHLFNRMTPLNHRDPGVVGAVFDSREVVAEIICDGVHVHPAAIRAAVAAKGVDRIMAITDGTGGSGMAQGTRAMLGGRPITVGNAAYLDDGTLAGSVLTMDRAFRMLVEMGFSLVQAARMCATTPARQRGLRSGCLRAGMYADLAVLNADLEVVETWIGGERIYQR